MDVRIVGTELPSRDWCDVRPNGIRYANVHVGIQRKNDVVERHPSDGAEAVRWELTIETVMSAGGEVDFRGPYVHGKRGERFLYLSWGTVDEAGSFTMFRRTKLMLGAIGSDLLVKASRTGHRLVGSLGLTGSDGGPRCAAVRPPAVTWRVERG